MPLDALPEEAREQVNRQRGEVEEILAAANRDDRDLAEAFGELGKLYYLYSRAGMAGISWENAASLAPGDVRWHYYLGVLYWVEGDHAAAEVHLLEALELRPGDLATMTRLADVELSLGRLESAATRFEAVVEVDPGQSAALFGLGRIAVAERRYADAVPLLERALEGQPPGSVVHHQLGLAYRGLGDMPAASRHLASNKSMAVSFPDPLMKQLVPLVRGAHFQARLGIDALKIGDVQRAVDSLENALRLDNESAWVRYNLAVAYREAGRLDDARRQLLEAIALDPDYRNAHFNLASQLGDRGDFTGAARHFGRAAEIDPDDYDARLELAVALSRSGDLTGALTTLERLVEEAPTFVPARLAHATLLAQMGRQLDALSATRAMLSVDATYAELAEAHLLAGRLVESGSPRQAEDHYRRALELGAPPPARCLLALVLGRQRRFDEAAAEFQRLIEAVPDSAEYRLGQTMALLLGESYRAARQTLEAARQQFPDTVGFVHTLARVLATCPDDAVRDGTQALELARQAFERQETLDHAETMGMALAEIGRFEDAANWQRQVVSQREQQGSAHSLERSRRYLALFEQGRAVRAPWLEEG
jgi:tetratricopeptide (TPR) repeat protein